MNNITRQIVLLLSIMLFLSTITIFLLQTSDVRTINLSSNSTEKSNTSMPSYNGPGSELVDESVKGLKELREDVDFSIFMQNTAKEDSNKSKN